jgi:hypothetical protein
VLFLPLWAAAGIGVWVALVSEVDEVSPWFLGTAYAVLAAAGIAVGVLARGRMDLGRDP